MEFLIFGLGGLIAGALCGLPGLGGGILLMPLLRCGLGLPPPGYRDGEIVLFVKSIPRGWQAVSFQ
jgi:uncharacterized membrane protein YfcA